MRVCQSALLYFTLVSTTTTTDAFVFPAGKFNNKLLVLSSDRIRRTGSLNSAVSNNNNNIKEFEHLLHENGVNNEKESSSTGVRTTTATTKPRSRRVVRSGYYKKVQLMSTTTEAEAAMEEAMEFDEEFDDDQELTEEERKENEFALTNQGVAMSESERKLLAQVEAKKNEGAPGVVVTWLKTTPPQELLISLLIPIVIGYAIVQKFVKKTTTVLATGSEDGLFTFSNEMIYHDGNLPEMELCHKEWSRKLNWLGLSKKKRMLDTYLEDYAKRKPVSPQSISSISYVFSLFELSEVKAAEVIVDHCLSSGRDTISSTTKLLFIALNIFQTPEALSKLDAIKELVISTYPEECTDEVREDMYKISQTAIGEAAYRTFLLKNGAADTLPDGWQALGLDEDNAIDVFYEEQKNGFLSDREFIYGGEDDKYNRKGQRVDKHGNLQDDKDVKAEEEKAAAGITDDGEKEAEDGIFECGGCGFTLFVAEGRGAKFYGTGFCCPECGAAKDKFFTVDESDMMNNDDDEE